MLVGNCLRFLRTASAVPWYHCFAMVGLLRRENFDESVGERVENICVRYMVVQRGGIELGEDIYLENAAIDVQLEIGMSTRRYFPANGTAGFERSIVRGYSRVPFPPPNTIAIAFCLFLPMFISPYW